MPHDALGAQLTVPRVSVIVPAYNAASVLGPALTSVAAQTYDDWQIVVADDGSTDDTAEIAAAHGPRVHVVSTGGRRSPAAARNTALAASDSQLVAFLDADDLWLPTYLESQVRCFDDASDRGGAVGIVACDAVLRSSEGDRDVTYLQQFRPPVTEITLERVLKRNCIYVSALVDRAAGDEVGWFSEELFGTEDHDLWIRILETGRAAVLNPQVLAVYRLSEGSISSNIARQGQNNQRTYRRALERGRLTRRQRKIALAELRYNRAMEAAARVRFEHSPRAALRALPQLAWVALSRPEHWSDWMRVLHRGDARAGQQTRRS